MGALHDLYRSTVLSHSRAPRNRRIPAGANRRGERHNPLCGDRIAVHLTLAEGRIAEVGFDGSGCAISIASASMLTERVLGLSPAEALALSAEVRALLQGEPGPEAGSLGEPGPEAGSLGKLGELGALGGVARYPVRIPCAAAAWLALEAALGTAGERG
jgi:nitrogen fixation protein NifU and related proteins